jgi:hypothetical protein
MFSSITFNYAIDGPRILGYNIIMNIDLIGPTDNDYKPKQALKYTLWCFYDKDDNLLYVTKNVNQGVMKLKDWWYDAVRTEIRHFATAGELEDAKIETMHQGKSKWNVHYNLPTSGGLPPHD